MPLAAPVITATFPSKRPIRMCLLLLAPPSRPWSCPRPELEPPPVTWC